MTAAARSHSAAARTPALASSRSRNLLVTARLVSRLVIAIQRRAHAKDHEIARVEANINVVKILQRPQKEAGGDQEDQRD